MATEALYAHVQSGVANALTVLRTELQQSLQEVATVTNAHEARLIALETSERTSSRRENVTAKRETKSLPSVRNMAPFMQTGPWTRWTRSLRPIS